ncbi:MAG: 2-oxoacid:acceptor oxidoreductase family protein [Dehalococcoidia bacterium]|nr:2-oxoacid:acceptor oxidoreductase family protein [Dehalococcoidia bacterium]
MIDGRSMDRMAARRELRVAGFGGQGVILFGEIVGKGASIFDKGYATLTQSYGPEARGGSCTAEVVVSREPIDYPRVVSPEVVVILAQEAYTNYGRNPAKGTVVIVDPDLVKPDPTVQPVPFSVPATRMARDMSRPVVANIIMLGFLAAVSDLVSHDALREAVRSSVPEGTEDLNLSAFDKGYAYGMEQFGGKRKAAN